jgi:hypothetical protein
MAQIRVGADVGTDVTAPRPLLPGDEVWIKRFVYNGRVPARTRWQQTRVVFTDSQLVTVRWYAAPHHEVRKTLAIHDVHRECPGEPLFSC